MLIPELTGADLDALRTRIDGDVVGPADPGWDDARRAWNVAFDQRPALVALPESAEDVRAVVAFARERGLRVAPQGTGHNAGPLGPLDGTILLSTVRMRGVSIDAQRRFARVDAGVLWAEVTGPASEHGLAPLAGSSPDVGVVGYTLGGGLSWLGRKHGLAADSVLAIEVVTADGRLRRVDADHDADLFWALRGGGGAFGVVTALEMRLYAAPAVYAGSLWWPWERSAEVLHAWREWTATAPDEVTTSFRIMQFPPLPIVPEPLRGRSWVTIDGAFLGDAAAGAELLRPLRDLAPELDLFESVPPAALSRIHGDPEEPTPAISVSSMLGALTPAVADALIEVAGPGSGSPMLMVELRHLGGALGRPAPHAGALGSLAGEYLMYACTIPMAPELVAAFEATAPRLLAALAPAGDGRGYLNFTEGETDPATFYEPAAYERLRAVKGAIDPGDVFRSNHPITS
jgi:FAD/FMN-containing dehydrogenase